MASNSISTSLLFSIEANLASFKSALDEGKSQLNGFGEQFNKIKEIAIAAFEFEAIKEGVEKLFEFSQQIGECTDKVAEFADLTHADLVDVTASIKATSDTFGLDFNEVLKSTNTLSKQLGISFKDASNLIQEGAALNHTRASEFLTVVQQYSPVLRDVGLTAEGTIAVLSQTLKSGVMSEDGVNSILKAGKNLSQLKQPALDALNAIGISGQAIQEQIKNGSLTTFQAIQQISEKLKQFKGDSIETAGIIDNVFGRTGRKVGLQYIESLSSMNLSMQNLTENTGESEKANLELAKASEDLNKVWVNMFGASATNWTLLKANITEVATKSIQWLISGTVDLINYFISLYNNSILFRTIVQDLVFQFKVLWNAIKLVAEMIFDTFSNAGRLIKDVFTGNIKDIPAAYKDAFNKLKDNIVSFAKDSAQDFKDGFEAVVKNKPIKLIDLNEVKKQGEEAGKELAGGILNTINGDDKSSAKGKNSKANKKEPHTLLGVNPNIFPTTLDGLTKIVTKIDGATKSTQYFATSIQKLGENFTKNIKEQAYPAAEALGEQLGTMAASGKASLADLANAALSSAKALIASSLSASLASAIKAAFQLPFPLDIAASVASIAAVNLAFSAIPAFESGGIAPGGLSLVGEKGAELVNLPGGSQVYNNSDTKRLLGNAGAGANFHLTLDSQIKGEDLRFILKQVERRRGNSSY